jgi:hypothetical protein
MRTSRLGGVLLTTGALIGVAAVIGLVVGFEPARLPAALLNIAAYKLTFVAAAGLLAAGAIVVRHGNRDKRERERSGTSSSHADDPSAAALPPNVGEAGFTAKREPAEGIRVPKDPSDTR